MPLFLPLSFYPSLYFSLSSLCVHLPLNSMFLLYLPLSSYSLLLLLLLLFFRQLPRQWQRLRRRRACRSDLGARWPATEPRGREGQPLRSSAKCEGTRARTEVLLLRVVWCCRSMCTYNLIVCVGGGGGGVEKNAWLYFSRPYLLRFLSHTTSYKLNPLICTHLIRFYSVLNVVVAGAFLSCCHCVKKANCEAITTTKCAN